MLEIKAKLSTLFHLQTDSQTKQMNQELEQYIYYKLKTLELVKNCYMQVLPSGNHISTVILSLNYTSLPSIAATFSQYTSW